MKPFLIVLALFLIFSCASVAHADIITAASCSKADIDNAWLGVTAATTEFIIPAGTCPWTAAVGLTLPSSGSIYIHGSSTTIGTCGPTTIGGSVGSCSAIDNTIITDNFASSSPLFVIATATGCTRTRIGGLTFQSGTGLVKQNGMIFISGGCHSTRVDHLHIDFASSIVSHKAFSVHDMYGVFDHNLIEQSTSAVQNAIDIEGDTASDSFGHANWAAATNFGGSNFLFIENNKITNGTAMDDCIRGGRNVVRYNDFTAVFAQTHPTGSDASSPIRGCRATEVYGNSFAANPACTEANPGFASCLGFGYFMSSGTLLFWGNNFPLVSGQAYSGISHLILITSMRKYTSPYGQVATPNGWGQCGTSVNGTASLWDGAQDNAGYPCLDQPGRGVGDLLNQSAFPNTRNTNGNSISWPNQALEPVYEWLNTFTHIPNNAFGSYTYSGNGSDDALSVLETRDFYSYTGSTSVTQGVGSGARASRPASCVTGVAYWSSDVNQLDKCTATNTWTNNYYAPYNYPHPYISGASCVTPDHVTFTAQPSSALRDAVLGTVTISLYDSLNNSCSSATNTITIANKGGTCSGMALSGTTSGAATAGAFTTTNLTENATGACTLTATSAGLTSGDSSQFTIFPPPVTTGLGRARQRIRSR